MQSLNRLIWGPTPQEKVRKWQSQLKSQSRLLDREIHQLDLASSKTKQEIKKLAQRGDVKNAKILAREVVRSGKQKSRLQTSKANLNSIHMQLGHQLAMVKVTGTLQQSSEIMKASNSLISVPQLSGTMREMSMEMMKAGIMQEMLDDTMESLDDANEDEEMEEEAQEEVDKVLWQITDGKFGQVGTKVGNLPVSHPLLLLLLLLSHEIDWVLCNPDETSGTDCRRIGKGSRNGTCDPRSLVFVMKSQFSFSQCTYSSLPFQNISKVCKEGCSIVCSCEFSNTVKTYRFFSIRFPNLSTS
jgi:charged multivesicular body protein 3